MGSPGNQGGSVSSQLALGPLTRGVTGEAPLGVAGPGHFQGGHLGGPRRQWLVAAGLGPPHPWDDWEGTAWRGWSGLSQAGP